MPVCVTYALSSYYAGRSWMTLVSQPRFALRPLDLRMLFNPYNEIVCTLVETGGIPVEFKVPALQVTGEIDGMVYEFVLCEVVLAAP